MGWQWILNLKGDIKMKYCNKCGSEINNNISICPDCGNILIPESELRKDEFNSAYFSGGGMLGVFLGLIGVGISIIILIAKRKEPKRYSSLVYGALLGYVVALICTVIFNL